jgi:hypothetical protein
MCIDKTCTDTSLITLPVTDPLVPKQLYYYTELASQRPFTGSAPDLPVGEWMENQVEYPIASLILTGLQPGDYLVNCNLLFQVGAYSGIPSTSINDVNFELRLNGVAIPYSTRNTTRPGGTPEDKISTDTTSGQITITAITDEIKVYGYFGPLGGAVVGQFEQAIVLSSGALMAHRKTVN